jgi:hypothetical protein
MLESPLPASLPAGSGLALYCSGTAHGSSGRVQAVELLVGDVRHDLNAVAMPRFDMPFRRSGFWGVIAVRAPDTEGALILRVQARTEDGARELVEIGRIDVAPTPDGTTSSQSNLPRDGAPELIAICMGTFEPQPALLEAQLDSLRSQTDSAWVCVISDDHSSAESYAMLESLVGDDERFVLSRASKRIGFYRNFERALTLAPPWAELIAFCDQDDVWYPDKLTVLRAAIGHAGLVYSDQRLVNADGRIIRETMWSGRSNNHSSLASLLMANSVTGASCLFRREVAKRALPFPDSPGIEFHDHWLALVALASGQIRYVDRPLYDYIQHDRAVLGKTKPPHETSWAWRRQPRVSRWRAAYFLAYVPGQVRAKTLLLRCADQLTPAQRRGLERYLAAERSLMALAWLLLRPLRAVWGQNETLATEWELARGVLWRRVAGAVARIPRLPERLLLDCRFPDPPHFEYRRLQRWRARARG